MANGPAFSLMCTSEMFGAVKFDIVGLIASRIDNTGHFFSPARSYDDSVKWILNEIDYMRMHAEDFRFIQ